MTLSEVSIKNPVFAWMLMSALILFGLISFMRMGISEMPDVDFPVVNISLTYEGAAPEIMETDIVDIVEETVLTIEGIRSISSVSRQDSASVTIEFDLSRDIDVALQEVQTKIAQAQRRLPDELDPPIVTKTNPEDNPIIWVSLSADKPLRDIMEYARRKIKDQLQTVAGVGEVVLSGYIEPNLRIWIDPAKLNAWELTVNDVVEAIKIGHVEIPAGRIETKEKEINIRSMGEALTPKDFENIQIKKRGGRPIYRPIFIRDVATVEAGLDDVRRLSRTNMIPSVGLGIKKQRGSNAVKVADGVKERLALIEKNLEPGYQIGVNFDSTKFIRETVHEMNFTLILSSLLTAIVCLLFLGSWGSTFNVLLAIPTSILGTFIILYFWGFTINTFTMLGLILAVGIVVDDAIMVLENIVRHQEMGKKPIQAALDGSREITGAAIAATLALIAIFLPVVFMKGVIGKFFFQFGVTMSVAVAISLLEALTLTPMRASRFIAVGESENRFAKAIDRGFEALLRAYHWLLTGCLRFRWMVLLLSIGLVVASFLLLPRIRKEFVPPQDQSIFIMRAQTPIGSSLNFTDDKMKIAEKILAETPEVQRFFAAIGGFGGDDANRGMFFITLKEPKDRPFNKDYGRSLRQTDVMDVLRKKFNAIPDFKAFPQDLSTRGLTAERGFPVEFTVRGPDWPQLTDSAIALQKKMEASPFFKDVDTDYQFGQPEIQIIPIRSAAAERQVSIEEIGHTIQAMIGGLDVGKFTEAGRRNDVRIRLREESRQSAKDISKLYVHNQLGELIPLSQLIEIKEKVTLKNITRKDRERAIGLFANLGTNVSQDKALKEVERLAKEVLPEGYRIVFSGSAQTFQESFQSLFFVLYLGIIVAYMVLASQYNSFIHPFTVLLALPFSVSGAFIALWLTNHSLNIFSFIGLILLMGIVKKNSILLVDFTNQRRDEGLSVREALLTACPQRLRPILMTSFATFAAAIPPALAFGPGAETRIPMAVVVLGGVFVSTFLTLFVVPCAYSLFSHLEKKEYGSKHLKVSSEA